MATYGWLERNDTRAIVDALEGDRTSAAPVCAWRIDGCGHRAAIRRPSSLASKRSWPKLRFANLREASYDYAGLRRYPWLGKTLFAPGTWTMIYRAESLANLPPSEVSPEKAVAARAFPVLLICDAADVALPCRHTQSIYGAARGPKQMWIVPGAFHTAALGYAPVEFRQSCAGVLRFRARRPLRKENAALRRPLGNPQCFDQVDPVTFNTIKTRSSS